MAGDLLAREGDQKPGEPLLELVMQAGKRLRPSPSLDDIRRHAKREFERLPEPLRSLKPGTAYPVEVAAELQELAAAFDRRMQAQDANAK
jgi:nicotinate phosphoribosyltransferase